MTLSQTVGGMASLIAVMLFLSTATLSMRFFARYRQKNSFGTDDYLVIPAWFFFLGLCIAAIYGMVRGFIGVTTPTDPQVFASLVPPFLQVYWAADLLSIFGVGFVRLSALFFYRRVFVTTRRWDAFGIITTIWIVIIILWMIGFPLLQIFECGSNVPMSLGPNASKSCLVVAYLEGFAISSFLLDLSVLILPIPKIWSLNMKPSKKIAVSFVFLMAATGAAASCTRMVYSMEIFIRGVAVVDKDRFLANSELYYFLVLELGLCLTAVNLPSLRYLFLGITPESALRSFRSMISLGSNRSARSATATKKQYDSETGSPSAELASLDIGTSPHRTRRDEHETEFSQA